MDGKENEEKSDARTLQKRTAATASNAAKRELMGDEAYLLEKRGWRKRKAERAAAAATSATAQPQPPPTDIVGKLSELCSAHRTLPNTCCRQPTDSARLTCSAPGGPHDSMRACPCTNRISP